MLLLTIFIVTHQIYTYGRTQAVESQGSSDLLPEECGQIAESQINRTLVNLYEFPWMALISYRTRGGNQFKCTGSIINSRYILTAAHCVAGRDILGVRLGEYDMRSTTDCQNDICESHVQDIAVAEKVIHENYTHSTHDFTDDIALLRVQKEIDFNHKNVDKICLPKTDKLKNSELEGQVGVVPGWGLATGHVSTVLQKNDIPILSNADCYSIPGIANQIRPPPAGEESEQNFKIYDNEFCGGVFGRHSCVGDSGGPLLLKGEYNGSSRYVQYGVASRGPRLCGPETASYGCYTDVTKYMDWVITNLRP